MSSLPIRASRVLVPTPQFVVDNVPALHVTTEDGMTRLIYCSRGKYMIWAFIAGAGLIAAELDGVIYILHAPILLCRLAALHLQRLQPPSPEPAIADCQHHSNDQPDNYSFRDGIRERAVNNCCVEPPTQAMPQMHLLQLQSNPAARQSWRASNPQLIGFRGSSAACMPYLAAPDECQASPI